MAMLHCRKILPVFLLTLGACSADDDPRTLTPDEDTGNAADVSVDLSVDAGNDANQLDDSGDPDAADTDVDSGDPTVCRPNHDGVIDASEVRVQAGLRATFKIAVDATFDTAGDDIDGVTTWDMTGNLATSDNLEIIELKDPMGQWFETTFPTATYYAQLSTSSALLGVFELTADQLQLNGVVSAEDGLFKSEIEYDPAVAVLKFPIQDGSTWTTEASVSGTLNGVFGIYSEDYTTVYAGAGALKTPYGTFDVIRLRTDLTRTVGVLTTTIRTYTFVAECFGTVAAVTSQDNEEAVEFGSAAEIRRLAR